MEDLESRMVGLALFNLLRSGVGQRAAGSVLVILGFKFSLVWNLMEKAVQALKEVETLENADAEKEACRSGRRQFR